MKKSTFLLPACLFLKVLLVFSLLPGNPVYSQENDFNKTSVKTGIGIGINAGLRETGMGLVYSVGWQKSVGKKNKLRINPNLTLGGFLPLGITDTRDQFYRMTTSCLESILN